MKPEREEVPSVACTRTKTKSATLIPAGDHPFPESAGGGDCGGRDAPVPFRPSFLRHLVVVDMMHAAKVAQIVHACMSRHVPSQRLFSPKTRGGKWKRNVKQKLFDANLLNFSAHVVINWTASSPLSRVAREIAMKDLTLFIFTRTAQAPIKK